MLKLIFCVCFVTFFSVINCNGDIAHVNVILQETGVNHEKSCIVEKPAYNLTMGTTVQVNIKDNISSSEPKESFYIHTITGNSTYSGFQKKTVLNISETYMINDSFTDYTLDFYFTLGRVSKQCNTKIHYENSPKGDPCISINERIMFVVICCIGVIIIIAETTLIFYCRSKFKSLTRHNNLTRLKEEDESEGDRYITNPKKKDKNFKPIIPEDNRQSEIYEEPNVTIGAPPPVPPGIPTSRSDHSNTSTLKLPPSSQTNGTPYPTIQRSKHPIPEPQPKILADRAPLPLPDEFYSKPEEEENVYEQLPQVQQSQKSLPPGPKPFLPTPQQLPLPHKPVPQQKQFAPPQKQFTPPSKPLSPPQKEIPPAQKQFPPSHNQFQLPKKQEPQTQKQVPLPQKQFPTLQKQIPPPQKQEPPPQKQFPVPQKQFPPPQNSPISSLKKPNSQTRAIQELQAKLQLEKPMKPPISQAKPTPPRNKTVPSAARMPSPPAPKPQPTVKLVLKPPAAKPKTPPLSPTTLEQQVQFFNQHRDDLPNNSSDDDDEWTYEPLYNI